MSGGQPRQVHQADAWVPVPGHRLGVRLAFAPGGARVPQRGKSAGEIGDEPFTIPRLNCSSCELEGNPCLPATDPRARRGGCRPAGAPWLASNCPRVGSAYQPLASLEDTWRELTIPAMIQVPWGGSGDGPALAEPGGLRISYNQLLQQTTTVARRPSASPGSTTRTATSSARTVPAHRSAVPRSTSPDRRRPHRRLAPRPAALRDGAGRCAHDGVQVPVPRRPGGREPSQWQKTRSAGCGLSARQSSECG